MSGIKGSAIESLLNDVNRLVDEGRIDRDALEARLEGQDLELLETKPQASSWYPLDSYERLSQLLLEIEGRGQVEYLVNRGRQAADRLSGTGMYSQLSADRERWGNRLGAMMASIGPAMFRDTTWNYVYGEGKEIFRIDVQVGDDFPEVARHAAQGFIDYLSQRYPESKITVVSRRVSKTEIEFLGVHR